MIKATVFEITYDEPTILKGDRWLVYANFKIVGENEQRVHESRLYFLTCSPEYQQHPDHNEPVKDEQRLMILDYLNKDKIDSYIREKIQDANRREFKNWPEYYEYLSQYFYIED